MLFLLAGLWALISGLLDLAAARAAYAGAFPDFDWNRDWTIVALSAEFTIALIPIAWILLAARPFARWMVSALGLWKIWWLVAGGPGAWLQAGLIALSIALLFTRSASRYFRRS
ncbi:hypothetical protein [Erythrobacter sp.]|jgi:hypothetical protein|uniref:hypothetical protein n=1 Tax=Erythrobacter sp. TaxID=1042 RepID=UPI002EA7601F|nr:hypothetical protein [Erythrobacter sp.]